MLVREPPRSGRYNLPAPYRVERLETGMSEISRLNVDAIALASSAREDLAPVKLAARELFERNFDKHQRANVRATNAMRELAAVADVEATADESQLKRNIRAFKTAKGELGIAKERLEDGVEDAGEAGDADLAADCRAALPIIDRVCDKIAGWVSEAKALVA